MPVEVRVNGRTISVPGGTVAAAAIALAGVTAFRSSVCGQPRGPICGMGICMECRATVNGQALRRTCLMVCEPGMEIETAV
jgi:sarcosine oxidase subunit alpha